MRTVAVEVVATRLGLRRRRLAGAALTLFVVAASALVPSGTAAARPRPQPTAVSAHYVALGDSYASGEGLAPYEAGTDTTTDGCHRSVRQSYPEVLTKRSLRRFDGLTSAACSGAGTAALFADAPDDSDEGPQLAALTAQTRTVTLTIGGNDIGFAAVVADCLYSPDRTLQAVLPGGGAGCRTRDDALVSARTAALAGQPGAPTFPDEVAIRDILLAVQARSPQADIYVSGYPKLFGTRATDALGCRVSPTLPIYVAEPDVHWIRAKATDLNQAIRLGVRQARRSGVAAHYVNVATPFAGHDVCDRRTPWLNGLKLITTPTPQLDPGSFHPTARGQRAYADAFQAGSRHPDHPGRPRT